MSRTAVIDRTEEAPARAQRQAAPEGRGHGSNGPLERVTVNLVARASRALQQVSDLTGDTKTDSINRAIQVYAYLEEVTAHGGEICIRESQDSDLRLLKMF